MNKHELHNIQRKLGLRIDEVAEVLGVELFTAQQWVSGTWPIPEIAEKFLHFLEEIHSPCDDNYIIYEDGYTKGYDFGFLKGVLAVTGMMLEEKQNEKEKCTKIHAGVG